jgi:hypothetical protein
MKGLLRGLSLGLLCLALAQSVGSPAAYSQTKETPIKAEKGPPPSDYPLTPRKPNDTTSPASRSRGSGFLHVDNQTPWTVDVYGSGVYIGTIGPFGDLGVYYTPGSLRLYAQANFADGSTLHWGPSYRSIISGRTSTWSLGN